MNQNGSQYELKEKGIIMFYTPNSYYIVQRKIYCFVLILVFPQPTNTKEHNLYILNVKDNIFTTKTHEIYA